MVCKSYYDISTARGCQGIGVLAIHILRVSTLQAQPSDRWVCVIQQLILDEKMVRNRKFTIENVPSPLRNSSHSSESTAHPLVSSSIGCIVFLASQECIPGQTESLVLLFKL